MPTDLNPTCAQASKGPIGPPAGAPAGTTRPTASPRDAIRALLPDPRSLLLLGVVSAQLLLLLFVAKQLDILIVRYRHLLYLVVPAFIANHLLPATWRHRAFAILSIFGLAFVLGDPPEAWRLFDVNLSIVNCLVVGTIGLAIIEICRLRVGFWLRATCLLLVAIPTAMLHVVLGETRYWLSTYTVSAIFMVRTIPYLYEVSTSPRRSEFWRALTYFFVPANGAIFNFPVMDFRIFAKSHYDTRAFVLYQRGATWMARGILQLVIFRWLERAMRIEPAAVAVGADLVRYFVYSYFRYLQVSGHMHLAIGTMLLFGFNLPETHHRYMLATSLADFWRRINIYWKDLMQKVFFYPIFFRFKSIGHRRALAVATVSVFAVSWALHLWMAWWWTLSPHLSLTNSLMWAAMGLLVAANALAENRTPRVSTRDTQHTWREHVQLIARTVATFSVVSVLMTLMYGPDPMEWCRMWTHLDLDALLWFATVVAAIACAKVVMEIIPERGLALREGWSYAWARTCRSDPAVFLTALVLLYVASQMPWSHGVGVPG